LGSLRVTEDYASDRNKTTKPASEEMLIVSTPAVHNETT